MRKRLFLSIPLNHTILDIFSQCRWKHQALRWTSKGNLHITLYFFGWIEEEMIPDLTAQIRDVCAKTPRFSLKFHEILFAPKRKPRMIWAEFSQHSHFQTLYESIGHIAQNFLHLQPDHKEATPHVTLARFRFPFKTGRISLDQPHVSDLRVSGCEFMQSHLTPKGPRYTVVEHFSFVHA